MLLAAPVGRFRWSVQGAAHGRQLAAITFSVAVVEELMVPLVGSANRTGVLDRAPVLFRARGDLSHIREQPVRITAEGTVDLLDPVQICELVSIDDEIRAPRHAGDPVDRKAHRLVERHPNVEEHERQEQGINERGRQKTDDVALANVLGNALPQTPVGTSHLVVEPHPSVVHPVVPPLLLRLDFQRQLLLGLPEAFRDTCNVG